MSNLEDKIKSLLDKQERSFNWLADQVGYTRQGLKSGLVNRTIKLESLERVSEVLGIDIITLFDAGEGTPVSLDNFFNNEMLEFVAQKFKTFYEKLAFYKDMFIWNVCTSIINGDDIVFQFVDPTNWNNEIANAYKKELMKIPKEQINKPYSKWGLQKQLEFQKNFQVLDFFYIYVFETNFYRITDLMADDIIKDKELIRHYKIWKKK